MLQKLVENSQNAIDDGIYDITETLPKSEIDLQESIGITVMHLLLPK